MKKRQEGNDPETEEEQLHVIRLKLNKIPPWTPFKFA
jgi:hypothetical protein